MSTDIKPGQVWAWNSDIDADESQFRILDVEGNRVRYEYLSENDPHLDGGFFRTGDTLQEKAHLTTPAPLDPSKVKAGDTVTLDVAPVGHAPGFTVEGEVYASDAPGNQSALCVGGFLFDHHRATLTAHQPAPEPEPEWKPGTTGTAHVVSGDATKGGRVFRKVRGMVVHRPAPIDDYMFVTTEGELWSLEGEYCKGFVPDETRSLPTRDDLARVMHDDYLPNGEPRLGRTAREVLADAVLAHLRGEVR